MPRALGAALAVLALAGCQKAGTYSPRPAASSSQTEAPRVEPTRAPDAPLPPDLAWTDAAGPAGDQARLVFVPTTADEWGKLPSFWNELPSGKGALVVKLRVPLGLDDPGPNVPPANPMTLPKWELGRRLFFDPSWLTAGGEQSCASCHDPARGFSDGKAVSAGGYNAPTLVNVLYARRLFWDGRARHLEEVVQTTLDDEREPSRPVPFRHVWPGVIGRLRGSARYQGLFQAAFRTPPTQDAVGKAIATYLRTLLAGNALHDRAVLEQAKTKAAALTAAHYEAVLDEGALKAPGQAGVGKAAVAAKLARGHELFNGKGLCKSCHPGPGVYSDGGFHNIGIEAERVYDARAPRLGRFSTAPVGLKNRFLLGAYKVPTLRGLARTGPYFHNGQEATLEGAVRYHLQPTIGARNLYLDPLLATDKGDHRDFGLSDDDVQALALFLRALDGEEVDRFVTTNPGP